MAKPFPLQKVLEYRRHLRLDRRNALAAAMAHERSYLDRQARVTNDRERQIAELSQLSQDQTMDIAATARRWYFASQLDIELRLVAQYIEKARQTVEACRQELIYADQEVKALERLQENFVAEQQFNANKQAELAMAEQWQAAHWGEFGLAANR